jgi:parvulin-like peptidyl-prolyl isomerase
MANKPPARRASSKHHIGSITYWRKFATHRVIYLFLAFVFGLGVVMYFGTSQVGPMSGGDGDATASDVIATVNGEEVLRGDFSKQDEMIRRAGMGSDEMIAGQQGQLISSMLDAAMLRGLAKKDGVTVTDAMIDRTLDRVRSQYGGSSKKPIADDDLVKLMGEKSIGDVRDKLQTDLLPQALGAKIANADKLTVDDLIKTYDEINVRHILVASNTSPRADGKGLPDEQAKRKAEQVLAKVNAGGDFAALANQYTDDPSNKSPKWDEKLKKSVPAPPKGGSMDWYKRGSGFDKAFEEAAFALQPGQVSGVVKTPFGYHIIKVDATRRNLPKDFEKEKGKLLDDLRDSRASEALRELRDKEQKTAKIVWKDQWFEWRYQYAKSSPMGMMGQMNFGQDQEASTKALVTMLNKYTSTHKDDSAAALILGRTLYQQYIMSGLNMGGAQAKPAADREALRKQVTDAYEMALQHTEDQPTRLSLARLYEEAGNKEKALTHFKMVDRLMQWDDSAASKPTRQQLKDAFARLGAVDLAAEQATKILALEAKEKADKEAAAKEAAAKAAAAKDAKKPAVTVAPGAAAAPAAAPAPAKDAPPKPADAKGAAPAKP